MDKFANAMMQNLPEMLARDLAEQEGVFLARSMTSGDPSADLVSEAQAPNLPQRNPSRVLHRLYQVAPETFLCSLRQNSVESAWRSEREAILKSVAYAASHCPSSRTTRRDHKSANKHFPMKQETEQDSRRLFLNGLDKDWGSDSSADIEATFSPLSGRTRKQSVTTAATSVDVPLSYGDKGAEGDTTGSNSPGSCSAGARASEDQSTVAYHAQDNATRGRSKGLGNRAGHHAPWLSMDGGGSWVDLGGHESSCAGVEVPEHNQEVESPRIVHKQIQIPHTEPAMFSLEDDRAGSHQQPPLGVPERRSSLSHQVTTVNLSETEDSQQTLAYKFSQEVASQQLLPSTSRSQCRIPFKYPSQADWNESEAALGPIVPTGRHHHRQNLQLDLSSVSPDELSLPPLSTTETSHYDRAPSLRSQQQQPPLPSPPRKSSSVTRMPLRHVHNWLESNSRARQNSPPLPITSPVVVSPTSSVRVSGHILEALRINVQNFPDTMLRTSSVTISQIRDYSHKVKRADATRQLVPNRDIDEQVTATSQCPTPPTSPSLGRKGSFGNLKFVSSLRGKFRFNASASATSINEQMEACWPPMDDAAPATARCDSPPVRPSAARDAACMNALLNVLPRGTPYLLDALYAHIIAYNYIDSLCASLPQLHQNASVPHLRTRPSQNVILPPGVTSLADLRVQENVSETIVREFQDDAASVASRGVVPSKAASLLGLGSTNMGKPVKPSSGLAGARDNGLCKTSPPGAFRSHYLESDSAMRSLREDIAHNIYRLVETVQTCSPAEGSDTEEAQDGNIVPNGKRLDEMLMRALSELVRSYEELSC